MRLGSSRTLQGSKMHAGHYRSFAKTWAGHKYLYTSSSKPLRLPCMAFRFDEAQESSECRSADVTLKAKRRGATRRGIAGPDRQSTQLTNNIVALPGFRRPIPLKRRANDQAIQMQGLHHLFTMMLASALTLSCICMASGVEVDSSWLPAAAGAALGGNFSLLGHWLHARHWRLPSVPLRVVITGSTKGIGKALAREFLSMPIEIPGCVIEVLLPDDSEAGRLCAPHITCFEQCALCNERADKGSKVLYQLEVEGPIHLFGSECDVSNPRSVRRLATEAQKKLGGVDVWINNAGCSGSFQAFTQMTDSQMAGVVNTNLLGSMLCTKAAEKMMRKQPEGGHIFNMIGAGSDGASTPQYGAYGATKAGIEQFSRSLHKEPSISHHHVKVHTLSPGMVLTALLLDGATVKNKFFFNILCVLPETSAAFLVPRIRCAAASPLSGRRISFLTVGRALLFLLTAPCRLSRFFNRQGEAVYSDEHTRFSDQKQVSRWLKEANALAIQDRFLALSYSAAMTAAYLVCCSPFLTT